MLESCVLISTKIQRLFWGIKPQGVLHVGAHLGEERAEYKGSGFGRIYWVEANPVLCDRLRKLTNEDVYQGLIWSESNIVRPFFLGENTAVSSTLTPNLVSDFYPSFQFVSEQSMKTITLEDLLPKSCKFNYLNLDIQGAELEAIKGMGQFLDQVDYLYTEVSIVKLYSDSALLPEIQKHLGELGFKKVALRLVSGKGWGEALFIRSNDLDLIHKCRVFLGYMLYKIVTIFVSLKDFLNRSKGFLRIRIRTKLPL